MYIIIAGHSAFAEELARLSLAKSTRNKVVLLVRDKDEALRIGSEIDSAIVVNGDATEPETFDDLNLNKCDIFVAATDSDKANVLSGIYAKSEGAKKIFVKIDEPEANPILKKLGFVPISPDLFAARSVELMLTRPAVNDLVSIGVGQFDMVEVKAKDTKLVGMKLGDAEGNHFNAIATYFEGKYDFANDRKIKAEDTLILLIVSGREKEAEKEYH
ncbi:MAG: TrkA family potassium uptake protein [Candidatus Diapherotrites archaeon]|nr:TrkA family potassium uptake protein [Candidatus Diapherotrites archaeon]